MTIPELPAGALREIVSPANVAPEPSSNATDLLLHRERSSPTSPLFGVPAPGSTPEAPVWQDVTAADFAADVRRIAKGLIAAGLEPGERIAFIARTSYEWTLVDFAIWFAGGVMVPVYETSSSSQLSWMLEDSEAVALITEDAGLDDIYDSLGDQAPPLRFRYRLEGGGLDALRREGESIDDARLEQARSAANEDDIATLIYTSGSTGRPKGVVLTHGNFVELCRNTEGALSSILNTSASTVLFITLAHVFARLIAVLCVYTGVKVGHQHDTRNLVPALGSFHPTFLLAVPRVFEKVYNAAAQTAAEGGKKKIFDRAVRVGVAWSRAKDAGHIPLGLALQYRLFDRLVFSKLRNRLGGRVEYAVSGSAPLGLFLGHFFRALGVSIMEGYGLTETTAPISVNLPDAFEIGTVGPPLPGCAVKIADDGELLTKGVNVFREYWKNPEATAAAFDEDGWFRTGDIGRLNERGYISITGRKKEIIVTAGGKNVAPAVLEDPIRSDVVIGECVVVGDGRQFISALITLDPEMLPKWLELHGLDPAMSLAEAAKNDQVRAKVQQVIDRANERVSRAESIRKFEILDHPFSIEDGTLTPKLSIKRHVILERYAPVIEAMYGGAHQTASIPTE